VSPLPQGQDTGTTTGSAAQGPAGTGDSSDSGKKAQAGDSNQVPMGKVTAIRLINPSSGWAGGEGWIARTDDGGKHWNVQYAGEEVVDQLFALNGREAWAVFGRKPGESGNRRLLHTTDGGKHWSPVGRVPDGGFLHFVSSREAFLANYHSSDGGETWSKLPVPSSLTGEAYFHDAKNGWAVTRTDGEFVVRRTTDGGKTWNEVMSRKLEGGLNGAVIRSAGTNDAWVECIGDSGMSQTSYSLFHTKDGGIHWQTVLANSTAGGGPAPGFPLNQTTGPVNRGSKPGPLYVVSTDVAYMGGECPACSNPNTIGKTTDGGKTWVNSEAVFPGDAGGLLAFADARHGWWICTNYKEPSVLYTTSDGGMHWVKVHTFNPAITG
jgi:photosystem II stability/assembly factor-like uncharacterized protein